MSTLAGEQAAAAVPEADFVSMHGVWSWVPPPVRDGIVRLLGDKVDARRRGACQLQFAASLGARAGDAADAARCGRRLGARSDSQATEGLKLVQELHAAGASSWSGRNG